jgi:hypothetical protein
MMFAWRAVNRHSPFRTIQKCVNRRFTFLPAKGALLIGVIASAPMTITTFS